MVIIDKLQLPSVKTLIPICIGLTMSAGVVGLLIFQKNYQAPAQTNPIVDVPMVEEVSQEATHHAHYDKTIEDITLSYGLLNTEHMINAMVGDIRFLDGQGWKVEEWLCTLNQCNSRYSRKNEKVFEYISLNKSGVAYEPIFNQDQLAYESVIYDLGEPDNSRFQNNLSVLPQCNDVMTRLYKFNTILTKNNIPVLTVLPPEQLFIHPKKYSWAAHDNLKKGQVTLSLDNVGVLGVFTEKFANDLFKYDGLNSLNSKSQINLSYFCL